MVPLQRGLLCPCAEMTHGVPSRHARAQRTDTHKERGKYTAPARRPQQLPGPPRPGPPRAAPTPQSCDPPHPTWRPNSARARSAKYRTRVPGKCGADQAGCAVAAAPGQTDGRVAATSMPGWGREQGRGRKGGLPWARPPGGAPTPTQGRAAGAGAPRPRAHRAHCAARPFVPLGTPRLHGVPGSTRAARGRGEREVERSVVAPLRAPLAPHAGRAPPPGAAMERPGPPERLCGARGGSALTLGQAAAGDGSACRRGCQSVAGGGDWSEMPSGAREARGASARKDAASGVCKWSEAGRRWRRPGADGDGPRRQGAQRPLPCSPRRGLRFPLPGSWRRARPWVCTPAGARPSRPAADWSLGRSPLLLIAFPSLLQM